MDRYECEIMDRYESDCIMEKRIVRSMHKMTAHLATIVHCSPKHVSACEVDGDGTLIFAFDTDPNYDPIFLNVDILAKTITDGETVVPIDVTALRKRLTRNMLKHLKSYSGA